ncbi:MAG: replication initiator protein [Microviridae sp.]|nr:MAG: replication initiator protein [Microviridae sp.]
MACYHPLGAWRGKLNDKAKRPVVFSSHEGAPGSALLIPCGRCLGCKLERARQWALRAMHESKLHRDNSFVTVTYDDGSLPAGGSLRLRDHQLFLKRLRERLDFPVRFMMCGEYGETTFRPHYHYLLFGYYPGDARLYSKSGGNPVYTSEFLDDIWGFGSVKVGAVTFDSAGYVARYTMKKLGDNKLSQVYDGLEPEFFLMSRRPGIGSDWAKLFYREWYQGDYSVVNGRKVKPPKYYDSLVEKLSPSTLHSVKECRKSARSQDEIDSDYSRGYVREEVKRSAVSTLSRKAL